MNDVEIRILTAEDTEAYWQCRMRALQREPSAFSSSVPDHLKLTRDEIRRRLTSDPANNFVFGVFANGRLAGTAGFVRESQVKMLHKGRVWGVYLDPELRGQGIGRKTMQSLLDRAQQIDGLEQIVLSVASTQDAAIALYRALGFVSWGKEPRALKLDDRYIDEQYMVLTLRG